MVRILPVAFRFLNRLGTLATQASRKFGLLRIFRTIGAGWSGAWTMPCGTMRCSRGNGKTNHRLTAVADGRSAANVS